jgi:hypothetical protein
MPTMGMGAPRAFSSGRSLAEESGRLEDSDMNVREEVREEGRDRVRRNYLA